MEKISGLALILMGLLHNLIALTIPGAIGFSGIWQEIIDAGVLDVVKPESPRIWGYYWFLVLGFLVLGFLVLGFLVLGFLVLGFLVLGFLVLGFLVLGFLMMLYGFLCYWIENQLHQPYTCVCRMESSSIFMFLHCIRHRYWILDTTCCR